MTSERSVGKEKKITDTPLTTILKSIIQKVLIIARYCSRNCPPSEVWVSLDTGGSYWADLFIFLFI